MQSNSSTAAISKSIKLTPEEAVELKLSVAEQDKVYRAVSQSYYNVSIASSSTAPLSIEERLQYASKAIHLRKLAMLNWNKIQKPTATDIKNFIYYRSDTALQYNDMAYIYAISAEDYIQSPDYYGYSLQCYQLSIKVLTEAMKIAGNTCHDLQYQGLFTARSPLPDINLIETIAASIDDIHKKIARCHKTEKRLLRKMDTFPLFPLPEKHETSQQFRDRVALTEFRFNIEFFYPGRPRANLDANAPRVRRSANERLAAEMEQELLRSQDTAGAALLPVRRP